jgi:hypothetical protein
MFKVNFAVFAFMQNEARHPKSTTLVQGVKAAKKSYIIQIMVGMGAQTDFWRKSDSLE